MRHVSLAVLLLLLLLLSCSDDESTKPDGTPPGVVTDLAIVVGVGEGLTLTWTAPGDDGGSGRAARYDIRCAASLAAEADWGSATALVDSTRVPKASGEPESLAVGWLDDGEWCFALKAADEASNWSALSNLVSTTRVDATAPGQVTDLAANLVTQATIRLTWTAPGDDGERGVASSYDLRCASAPITEESWGAAQPVEGLPLPGEPGSTETFMVTGLEQGTPYNFALKAIDNAGHESELSNALSASTARLARLTTTAPFFPQYGAGEAAWSPDGQRIAFAADWGEGYRWLDIYWMPASGGDHERLTWEEFEAYSPCWSPDGTRLAFGCMHEVNRYFVLAMDPVPGAVADVLLADTHADGIRWSRDGARLAYWVIEWSATPPYRIVGGHIYAVDLAGGAPRHLAGDTQEILGADWSPDGSQIIFGSARGSLWIVSASGGTPTRLTPDSEANRWPAWSPDGSRIAFRSRRTGNGEIWLMTPTGEDAVQLTFGSLGGASRPAWSPDGKAIAFQVYEEDRQAYDIWTLRWD